MPKTPITLIKGDSAGVETDYRDALPVNMFGIMKPILGADGYMLAYPGLTKFTDGVGIDRGALYNERFKKQYRVSGTSFIRVNTNGTVSFIGAIPGIEQVSLPYSFNTQAIIADGRMWLYSPTGGFNEVVDIDLGDPIDGVWIDGYYFLTDGEYLYHTDITNESSIDPLKFATAEFSPDPSLGVDKTQDNKVMVFGRYTLEYFEDVASENFAFTRLPNRAQKIGIVATHAKVELGDAYYIVGGRKDEGLAVHQVGIGQAVKVSTREIDKLLATYNEPELADIRLEGRLDDDVAVLLIHLPNEVLCFNVTLAAKFGIGMAWSILETITYDQAGTSVVEYDAPHRAINGVFDANLGRWVYGDKHNSCIGLLDNEVFTQYDEKEQWLLYTPLIDLEMQTVDELLIDTLPGNTIYDDATVAVALTYDGLNWSSEEWVMYGEALDYNQRFILRRLGDVSNWVGFRFRGYTKSKMAFAMIEIVHG